MPDYDKADAVALRVGRLVLFLALLAGSVLLLFVLLNGFEVWAVCGFEFFIKATGYDPTCTLTH